MPSDDESTPRTSHRPSGEYGPEDITRFRLDRIEAQNQEQSRKLDKLTTMLTRHVERQDSHDKRITNVEGSFSRAMWLSLTSALGAVVSMLAAFLPHSDKVSK